MKKLLLLLGLLLVAPVVFAANNSVFITGYVTTNASRTYDFNLSIYNSSTYIGNFNTSTPNYQVLNQGTVSSSGGTIFSQALNNSLLTGYPTYSGITSPYCHVSYYQIQYTNGSTVNTEQYSLCGSGTHSFTENVSLNIPVKNITLYLYSASGTGSDCYTPHGGCLVSYVTPGFINASLSPGTYTFIANDTRYAGTNESHTITNATSNNFTFNFYSSNTITFYIRDENTQQLITGTNVTISLSGNILGYNYTTSNGSVSAPLLVADTYLVTVNATAYSTRTYIVTVTSNTFQTITLYLLPASSYNTLLISDVDQSYNSITGYNNSLVRLNASGTNYYEVERCSADNNGQCLVSANVCTINDSTCSFYKVIVYDHEGNQIGSTSPLKFSYSSSVQCAAATCLTILINLNNNNIEEYSNYLGITQGLSSWNTTNATITYTFDNSNNLASSVELVVQRRIGASLYNVYDITTSGTGTLVLTSTATDPSLGEEFVAYAYWTDSDGVVHLGDTDSFNPSDSGIGNAKNSAFVWVIMGIDLAPLLLFGFSPPLAIAMSVVFTLITSLTGLTALPQNVIIGLAILGAIILWRFFK